MRYLSLFSGIEACTVAWEPLGWECAGVAEIEPFPCHVLHERFGASRPRYMPENDFKAVKNLPTQTGLINFGDVSQVVEQDIKNLGRIDFVVFGSPCQNLSVAGNRKGLQGESSGLFYEAIRLIQYARKHCGLRFALWENVPGSFSSNKGNDFREVVRELSANRDINTPENGWGNTGVALGENGLVEWRVLDAQYFGLAQRRKRVFAIVDFGNWMDRPPILLEPKGVCGNTPPSRETGQKATAIATQRLASGGEVTGILQANCGQKQWLGNQEAFTGQFHVVHGTQDPITSETTANCLGRNNGQENVVAYSIIAEATPKIGEDICGTLRSQGGGGIVPPSVAYAFDTKQQTPKIDKGVTQTLVATGYKEPLGGVVAIAGNIIGRSPQHGGNHTGIDDTDISYTLTTADRHGVCYLESNQNNATIFDDAQPCTTLPASMGMGGGYVPMVAKKLPPTSIIRRLTPVECERLQGFPDNYTQIPYRKKDIDQCPDSPRYKALGNSMAVPVMTWIGRQIQKAVAA